MNEKIKEIAEQAGLKHRVWNSLGKELPIWQEDPNDPGLEKFVDLIVQECIVKLANDTANYHGEGMMAYYQGVQDAAKALKRHFGIE